LLTSFARSLDHPKLQDKKAKKTQKVIEIYKHAAFPLFFDNLDDPHAII